MVGDEIAIRQATEADTPELIWLRRVMFEAMGFDDPAQLDSADAAVGVADLPDSVGVLELIEAKFNQGQE